MVQENVSFNNVEIQLLWNTVLRKLALNNVGNSDGGMVAVLYWQRFLHLVRLNNCILHSL